MTNKTKIVRGTLTGVGGVLGASIAVAVVGVLTLVPLPQFAPGVPVFQVTPIASTQNLVCPGPLVQVNSDKNATVSYLSNGAPSLLSDSTSSKLTSTPLAMTDNKAPAAMGSPLVLSVPADRGASEQPLVAGTQIQPGAPESLAGLATVACAEPSNESWLVGGATDVGRMTLLVLENPTEIFSTAKLDIYGEKGQVTLLKSDGISVPPKTQRIISISGYARDVYAPVVHVTSSGGALLATLQQSVTRVLTPSGVEWINPSATPNTTQIMTGVYLSGVGASDDAEHGAVSSDLESAVRVLVPGAENADVKISVISLAGEVTEISGSMTAKQVIQFPFVGIKDGMYTVVVKATKPVLAGVRSVVAAGFQNPVLNATPAPTSTATASPSATSTASPSASPSPSATTPPAPAPAAAVGGDFAWFSSGTFLSPSLMLPTPNGPNPMASFFNPGVNSATVTLSARNQRDISLTMEPNKMAAVALVGGVTYTVKGAGGLIGQLTYMGGGQGAGVTLNPANALGSMIAVFPR